ncbi:histidinol-phosphate transaminase [Curvivirga sp.]|uniref:histidinol-phosphate transaminase n=1 Tax=Curvivirga sp. TaxID=2856848 RepID=UPI003B5A50D7
MPLVARPGIADCPLYVPGSHEVEGIAEPVVLSANENPLGPSDKAVAAYQAAATQLHRYPEGGAVELRDAIGKRFGLNPEQITCGAGSDEILTFLTRIFAGPGDEVLYSQHGFLMYPINAKQVGATPVQAPESNLRTDVQAVLDSINEKTKIVFIANPNNPTGSYLTTEEMKTLVEGVPENVLLVLDSAYAEYVERNDYSDGSQFVEKYPNVVMTRTFSKIFGLAAVRLGWCYASPEVTDLLNRLRGPFNTTAPSQAAGVAAVEDLSHTDDARAHNNVWLPKLTNELEKLGAIVPPSVCNFLLAGFGDADTTQAAYDYMHKNGVITRMMGGYGLPEYIRITIGTEKENKLLLDVLRNFKG